MKHPADHLRAGLSAPLAASARLRRTGLDLPWQDLRRPHGTPFEGWYWRFTNREGRVAVGLCALCRDDRGLWGFAGIATDRNRFFTSAVMQHARTDGLHIIAPPVLDATPERVSMRIGDARLEATLRGSRPIRGLGPAHFVPGLPQYWSPHALGVRAEATVSAGGETLVLDRAYAEKNWARAFPRRWWWGAAHDFGEGVDACVAFAGGPLAPRIAPSAAVVRVGQRTRVFGPLIRADVGDGRWTLRGCGLRIDGEAETDDAHGLTIPVPDERREHPGARQNLSGRLRVRVSGFDGVSEPAGLEHGILS